MNELQRQYAGYLRTTLLWKEEFFGLKQFSIADETTHSYNESISKPLRLGHLVEHFVHFDLNRDNTLKVLGRNIQINGPHATLGELDFIVQRAHEVYHIESSYKFYLWDGSVSNDPIQNWIGPNRRDALYLKLNKIKSAQFPLIRDKNTIEQLNDLGISTESILQRVYFKGQLFIPPSENHQLLGLNRDCIQGYYYRINELADFSNDQFFVPSKLNWLCDVHTNVHWVDFNKLLDESYLIKTSKQSTIVWRKTQKGVLSKFFLVWWN